MQITVKLRLKDKHAAELNQQARAVNFVWNYCNETQQKAARDERRWLTGYDLCRLTAGSVKEGLDLYATTVQRVCIQYARSRQQQNKPWLRWRVSKSLGWIPFNTDNVNFNGSTFKFRGIQYSTMHLRSCLKPGVKIGAGSFNADSRGRWYINVPVEVDTANVAPIKSVGIDLGLHSLAALSDGHKIKAPRFYRASEKALGIVQRAHKSKRIRAINAKIKNRRLDHLHKTSAQITSEFGFIAIGDVSSDKLVKTSRAKSVLDAGWSDLKRMLSYKSIRNGGSMLEVSEYLTSQTCSSCGSLPPERPTGIAGLGIREWTCSDCGTAHDRDVNAARNILRLGLQTLAGGTSILSKSSQSKAPFKEDNYATKC